MVSWDSGPRFEIAAHASMWLGASLLASIAGRPALAALGGLTVAPFLALAWARERARRRADRAAEHGA